MTSEEILMMAQDTIRNRVRARIWDVFRIGLTIVMLGFFLYLAFYVDNTRLGFFFSLVGIVSSSVGVYLVIKLIYSHENLVKSSMDLVNCYEEQEKKAKALSSNFSRDA